MEKRDLDAVDAEVAEQGRIDHLDAPPEEKLRRRTEVRRELDEAVDADPRPEHPRE